MSNYDLQNIVTLPCPELLCIQEAQLTLPLERYSSLHMHSGQPKQGFCSWVGPIDISHLPCIVNWTSWKHMKTGLCSKEQVHQRTLLEARPETWCAGVWNSLGLPIYMWLIDMKYTCDWRPHWLVTSITQERLNYWEQIRVGLPLTWLLCSPMAWGSSGCPHSGVRPAKPGVNSSLSPWSREDTLLLSFSFLADVAAVVPLHSQLSATANQGLSILGNTSYFKQWGLGPTCSWKPKATKLWLKYPEVHLWAAWPSMSFTSRKEKYFL